MKNGTKAINNAGSKPDAANCSEVTCISNSPRIEICINGQVCYVDTQEQADYCQMNSLTPYEENLSKHINVRATQIINTSNALSAFIRNHIDGKGFHRALIGRLSNETVERINRDLGFDAKNIGISIDSSHLKHIYDEHIDPKSSKPNPISIDELSLIPKVIAEYDRAFPTADKRTGEIKYAFEKRVGGEYRGVTVYSRKKGNLMVDSFYKTKMRKTNEISLVLAGDASEEARPTTFETGASVSSVGCNPNIPTNTNEVNLGHAESCRHKKSLKKNR